MEEEKQTVKERKGSYLTSICDKARMFNIFLRVCFFGVTFFYGRKNKRKVPVNYFKSKVKVNEIVI